MTNAEDLHWTSLLVQLARIKGAGGFEHMVNVTGGAQESRVVGGTFRIAQRMADDLGAAVVLESPVTEISQNSDGVTVRSARIDVHADRVIVAMSPADASRINFTPDLPTRRSMLQRRWSSGSESKLFAVYDRPFWREQGLNGQAVSDLPVANFVIDNSPPDASVGILLTFMGTAGSGCLQSWPDQLLDNPDARRDAVLADLTTLFGPQAAKPIAFLEKDWAHEPWINGCVGSRAPGSLTQYTDADRRPVGRIHWAGTETATVNQGYFDGAVSAAERAAAEVLSTSRCRQSGGVVMTEQHTGAGGRHRPEPDPRRRPHRVHGRGVRRAADGVRGLIPLMLGSGNGIGTPVDFVIVGVVLVLFTVGYSAMTPRSATPAPSTLCAARPRHRGRPRRRRAGPGHLLAAHRVRRGLPRCRRA